MTLQGYHIKEILTKRKMVHQANLFSIKIKKTLRQKWYQRKRWLFYSNKRVGQEDLEITNA